jgi:Uma2 family endonuclease
VIRLPWRSEPLTEEQVLDHFMRTLEDDTEDAPWMVMGDLQFWSASGFAHSLRNYSNAHRLGWYVAGMHPIRYTWRDSPTKRQLAPDVYVALVPDHPRSSYDVDVEGSFPPFVLEVVSPASTGRDQIEKRLAYDLLGAREYARFTPRLIDPSRLEGDRRTPEGRYEAWLPDEEGRLWSEVLGLYLVVHGRNLQAMTRAGELLLTPDQSEEARLHAEEARRQVELDRDREAQARREAEAEVERLRQELNRRQSEL